MQISNALGLAGIFLAFILHLIIPKTPHWISEIGLLMLPVSLVFILVDEITARKQKERAAQAGGR